MALVIVAAFTAMTASTAAAAVGEPGPTHAGAPVCPPDCGAIAEGDALLVPYLLDDPGPEWSVLPAAVNRSYVDALRRGLQRVDHGRTPTNVAAGKWVWNAGGFSLLVVLVSAGSLSGPRLASPVANAEDLCASSHGEPGGRLITVTGIPGSVAGVCGIKGRSTVEPATIVTFDRGNVAVLMEVTSATGKIMSQSVVTFAAQQQYLALPAGGILVSEGGDLALLLVWILLLAAIVGSLVAFVRRRRDVRAPFVRLAEAFRRRLLPLGVSLVAVVGAMAFSMVDFSLLHGFGRWYESGFNDFWRAWASSAYMTFGGGYSHIYALNSALETAPTVQLVAAPVARLAFGLPFPYPGDVLYPTAFWVAGPLFLSAMALPICAADRWLALMGVTDIRRRLLVLGTLAVTLPPIGLDGHPEDLIALGAALYGLTAAFEGRHRATGWWLGLGLAFQFLSFLAIPMALVLLPRRRWLEAVGRMLVLPVAVLVVPLVGDPGGTLHQLFHQQVYDDFGYITPTWRLDPGVAALFRGLIALCAIPAAAVLARWLPENRRSAANVVVWTLGLLFALRVLEPELVPYFLAPALALQAISAGRAPWWRLGATCALALWLNWWLHVAVDARWSAWVILMAQLAALAWLGRPGRSPQVVAPPPKTARKTPQPPRKPTPARAAARR